MAAGLTVYNDDGIVQIDENYPCLALRQKGRLTSSYKPPYVRDGVGNVRDVYAVDIVYYSITSPIIAVRPVIQNAVAAIIAASRSGSQWIFRVLVSGDSAAHLDYWIFDTPAPVASGVGLEVYREDGTLAFSSAAPLLNFRLGNVDPSTGQITNLDLGRVYAWFFHTALIYNGNTDIWTDLSMYSVWWFGGNFVACNQFGYWLGSYGIWGGGGEGPDPGAPNMGDGLDSWAGGENGPYMIDVTGL